MEVWSGIGEELNMVQKWFCYLLQWEFRNNKLKSRATINSTRPSRTPLATMVYVYSIKADDIHSILVDNLYSMLQ
ncbi:unnamed protein product [Bursaphelenchus okinawaensis]|uniref:Uncharacterized protein n=1 Tax=Bursaphelenchus okinawaensis TaxID=465554 RepID=A0A811LRB8_9BILA|nr:unnamed protein product [Bursaphelenchus okinawaensis]CAG9127174.1 unnamed protein product [Bursaphelenchus okinawaensis]